MTTVEKIKVPEKKKAAKVSRVPPNETKHDKFLRLGKQRTINTLEKIRQLGNLGDGAYEYSEEEKQRILTALGDAVNVLRQRFEKREKSVTDFSF